MKESYQTFLAPIIIAILMLRYITFLIRKINRREKLIWNFLKLRAYKSKRHTKKVPQKKEK
tara:strand:+ start:1871 stop:2053 length:183 start_codon:yes stop_codon:yes gene_type:complete